jgi:ArsR family metal-binding transcriptional regulator
MAIRQPNFPRHETLVRNSIQIPLPQHTELNALAMELESSLGDIMETIMELMRRDNYEQLKSALIQKREVALTNLNLSLDEAYSYLGTLPETLEEACFCFEAGCDTIEITHESLFA